MPRHVCFSGIGVKKGQELSGVYDDERAAASLAKTLIDKLLIFY